MPDPDDLNQQADEAEKQGQDKAEALRDAADKQEDADQEWPFT
jgi:hypothetical protein